MSKVILGINKVKISEKIPLISIINTGFQFATKGYIEYRKGYRKKQQWKVIFHTLFNLRFAHHWFEILKSSNFSFVFKHRPRLYIKPFRPYISTKWSKEKKVKVILDTYRFIEKKVQDFFETLTCTEGKVIANFVLSNKYEGVLKLGYDDRFRKEGELVLSLECSQLGGKIISASFSFEEIEKGNWACIIGCVQGHTHDTDKQNSTKILQKLMFGIRPKAFIIFSIQELSRSFGCESIYAVGDSIQAYRKKHAIHLHWNHHIHFNYDKFWHEVSGKYLGEGWFELPLIPVRKEIHEIKSKKRSMYRKRYQMLDSISMKIINYVSDM